MQLLKPKTVCQRLGISLSTLKRKRLIDPSFPKARYLSPRRVGFVEGELQEWLDTVAIEAK